MCVTLGGCSILTQSFHKSIARHSHFFLATAIIDFASAGIRPTRTNSIDLSPASSRRVLSGCTDQNLTYPSSHRLRAGTSRCYFALTSSLMAPPRYAVPDSRREFITHVSYGSKTVLTPLKWDVWITPESRHRSAYAADCTVIICYGGSQARRPAPCLQGVLY